MEASQPPKRQRKPDGRKRDAKGKFLKGDSGGPGRPTRDHEIATALAESEYLRSYRRSVPLDQFNAIVGRLLKLCEHKQPMISIRAMSLLFQYLLPMPESRQRIEQTLQHSVADRTEFRVAGRSVEELDSQLVELFRGALGEGALRVVARKYVESTPIEPQPAAPQPPPVAPPQPTTSRSKSNTRSNTTAERPLLLAPTY